MDFVTRLPNSVDKKDNSYNFILVIVDWLIKIVHYKLVKVIIDAPELAKVFLDVALQHHNLLNFIITDQSLFFTSKF